MPFKWFAEDGEVKPSVKRFRAGDERVGRHQRALQDQLGAWQSSGSASEALCAPLPPRPHLFSRCACCGREVALLRAGPQYVVCPGCRSWRPGLEVARVPGGKARFGVLSRLRCPGRWLLVQKWFLPRFPDGATSSLACYVFAFHWCQHFW